MSLDIQIKVDATQALPAAKSVETALEKVEQAGKEAGDQTSSAVRKAGDEMDRTGKKAGGLAQVMTKAFAGAVTIGAAKEVMALSDAHTGLKNRLRQVAGSQEELNKLMDRTKDIANRTRSDWKTTAESFVRLSQATKELGLSQERGLKITETLNMALQSSGVSSSEAAAGTLQLMQAMSAGALQGDEFRSLAENLPVLMDVLAKQLGVTRGELKKMGAEGKITTDVMIKGLESFAGQAKKTFEEADLTWSQVGTQMKNAAVDFAGSSRIFADVLENHDALLQKQRVTTLEQIANSKELADVYKKYDHELGELDQTTAKYILTAINSVDAGFKVSMMVKDQLEHMTKLRKEVERLASIDPWGDNRSGFRKLKDRAGVWVDNLKGAAEKRIEQQKDAAGEDKTYAHDYDEYGVESGRDARETQVQSQTDFSGVSDISGSLSSATMEAVAFERELEKIDLAAKKYELDMASANDGVAQGFNKIGDEIMNTSALIEGTMVKSFHSMEDALVQAAVSGQLSFGDMVEQMMADLARLIIRLTIAKALTSAIGGPALGGGGLLPLPALSLPRFATGGSFMVGGSGGTDTTPVAFMATPGEKVTVETPSQQAASNSSGGGKQPLTVVLADGRDELETEDFILQVIRRNAPKIRGVITGR